MARALEAIMKELNSVYNPQREIYNKQINALPGQQEAQMKSLRGARDDAFNQITTMANRRGVAFGGIPLDEQYKYEANTFAPALLNAQQRFQQRGDTLRAALEEIGQKQSERAQSIWQWEREQDALAAERAAARRAASGGGGGGGFDWTPPTPTINNNLGSGASGYASYQNKDGSFKFTGPNGQPISAATYAKAEGIDFINLVKQMASAGDKGARQIQNLVGSDFGYDPNKIAGKENIYNAFIWDTPYQQATRYTGSGVRAPNSLPTSSGNNRLLRPFGG